MKLKMGLISRDEYLKLKEENYAFLSDYIWVNKNNSFDKLINYIIEERISIYLYLNIYIYKIL